MKKGMVFGTIFGLTVGIAAGGAIIMKQSVESSKKIEKFKQYYYMLNDWMKLYKKGHSLTEYFINEGYTRIAIYGMGEVGRRLCEELKDSEVQIQYAIDKNATFCDQDFRIVDIEDDLEEVDIVVVTTTFAFDEISLILEEKLSCPIISLNDIISRLVD